MFSSVSLGLFLLPVTMNTAFATDRRTQLILFPTSLRFSATALSCIHSFILWSPPTRTLWTSDKNKNEMRKQWGQIRKKKNNKLMSEQTQQKMRDYLSSGETYYKSCNSTCTVFVLIEITPVYFCIHSLRCLQTL